MDILQIIILGIIEGVTEFLPISSTGHLIVVSHWMGVAQTESNKAMEVMIQLAAILAVIANYRDKFSLKHRELWLKVCVSFLPIALIGAIFYQPIKMLFTIEVVAIMFIVGGVVFLVLEYFYKEESAQIYNVEAMTYRQAFWIGIAQVFALIPGASRAGASIVGALLVGLSRKASAEFSFLLALPVLFGAASLDLWKHYEAFNQKDVFILLIGFVTAFVVAYMTMKLFIRFLERFTFVAFGIYRILFGVLLLWWWV
ncbi:MAG: undecaprenyl-diphosphate phosphatase [Mariprofundaceae bacterium]|nr:undecaprenyl-diphosphate phosphatase [Mariprofundaceae bacterium]